jgi:D-alanyl-D-alanine carboxypeptidase (penicillin-binding protein 5/6)
VSVVLGAASDSSRAAESQKLLNWGFQAFDTVSLYQSGKPVTTLRVWKGAKHDVAAGFVADRYLTLPKGNSDKLALTLESKDPLVAPVLNGQPVGTVKVALEGKPVAQFPLLALEEVPLANLFGRAVDTVKLWFAR